MKSLLTSLLFFFLIGSIYSQITIISQPFGGSSICQGTDPDMNTDFQFWLQQQTTNLETIGASSVCGTITATPIYTPSDWINTGCTFNVSIQWNVSDNCGSTPLFSTAVNYTISDTQAPQFLGINGTTIATIECDGTGNQGDIESEIVAYINSLTSFDISDDCTETADLRNSIVFPFVESTSGFCNETLAVDLIMTDNCGNIGTTSVNIIIEDITSPDLPIIDLNDPNFQSVECLSDVPTTFTISVNDGCGNSMDVNGLINTSDVICESQGIVHVEFPIEDACGNVNPNSPLVIDIPIQQVSGNELVFLNSGENLPGDIALTISTLQCQSLYSFPGGVWVEDISDFNSNTWPNPSSFVAGVHYNDPCGSAVFTSTHFPTGIELGNGPVIVTYKLEDGCGGDPTLHEFEVDANCAACSLGSGALFCPNCETSIDSGCFTCDANELLNGFASCLPPSDGSIQGAPQPIPICNNGVPENMSWFSFIAGTPNLEIDIQPTECIPGPFAGLVGIQAGIWDFCDGVCIAGDDSCPGDLSPKSITLNNLIVGNTYHLFVDGCTGSICSYEILIEGQEGFFLDDIQSVIVEPICFSSINNNFCSGQQVRFNATHDGSSPTDNGIYNAAGSNYDPDLDLCFEWSFSTPINGVSQASYSQLNEGGPSPIFTLPDVTESTEIEICITEVSGPCAEGCDEAECVGNCCTTITVLPASACTDLDICSISNTTVETSDCDADGIYFVNFGFDYNSPSCDGFTASIVGELLGEFEYGENQYTVGPFDSCGEITELIINDNVNSNCSTTIAVPQSNCCMNDPCMISDFTAGPTPCNSDGVYFVDFTFNVQNPSDDGFVARSNSTVFGEFDYGQSSYRIGPFDDCDDIVDLFLIDNNDTACTAFTEVEPADCCLGSQCNVTNLIAETLPCNVDGVFFVDFEFDIENPGSNGFTARGNGTVFGEFDYGETFYTIGPFDSCDEINELVIIDNDNVDCSSAIAIEAPDCCTTNNECSIINLFAETGNCDADNNYTVDFEFDIGNPGDNGFTARGNGTFFGEFDYGETFYTIGPFDSCDEINELVIIDNNNVDCSSAIAIEAPDCCTNNNPCSITNLFAESSDCDTDSTFTVGFEFDVNNPGSNGFTARGNGIVFGEFEYGETFYTIGPFNTCDEINELVIIDNDNTDCSTAIAIEAPDCCRSNIECSIEDLFILDYNIDINGFLNVTFDFVERGTAGLGFDLFVNGEFFSFNEYSDIAYEIVIESFNLEEPLTLTVCENDDTDCCDSTTIELENIDTCIIDEFSLVQTECMDGIYFYVLDFSIPLAQDSAEFTLEGNGNEYGIFVLSDLPVAIGPFDINDINDELFITVEEGEIECVINLSLNPFCDIVDSSEDLLNGDIDIALINNTIKVTTDLNVESQIYVYNIIGQLSYKGLFRNDITIPTDQYNSGIHVIHIRNSLGRLTQKVFIGR